MSESARQKISMFSNVDIDQVISMPDVNNIFKVPLILFEHKITHWLADKFGLESLKKKLAESDAIAVNRMSLNGEDLFKSSQIMQKWIELNNRSDGLSKSVEIAIVGKYTTQSDTYTSINKALEHAGLESNRQVIIKYVDSSNLEKQVKNEDPVLYHQAWQIVCKCDAVLVPGGFGTRGTEGMIAAANWARVNKRPYLGICLGFQCAVIEFARNVLNLKDASSSEFDKKTANQVIIEMPEHNQGQMGGTMRLGKRRTIFKSNDSVLRKLYGGVEYVDERHRHRYEVNPKYVEDLEKNGMKFLGRSEDGNRMEIMELQDHPYYVGVQYHPEYLSRPTRPSAPYVGFVLAAAGKLNAIIENKNLILNSRKFFYLNAHDGSQATLTKDEN